LKLVANQGWQPGFPTSFQLVRLVGCGPKLTRQHPPRQTDIYEVHVGLICYCTLQYDYKLIRYNIVVVYVQAPH